MDAIHFQQMSLTDLHAFLLYRYQPLWPKMNIEITKTFRDEPIILILYQIKERYLYEKINISQSVNGNYQLNLCCVRNHYVIREIFEDKSEKDIIHLLDDTIKIWYEKCEDTENRMNQIREEIEKRGWKGFQEEMIVSTNFGIEVRHENYVFDFLNRGLKTENHQLEVSKLGYRKSYESDDFETLFEYMAEYMKEKI